MLQCHVAHSFNRSSHYYSLRVVFDGRLLHDRPTNQPSIMSLAKELHDILKQVCKVDEGDTNHLANGGKYVFAMLAAGAKPIFAMQPTPLWLAMVIITSYVAIIY
ncbi:hypothetical protein MRB53_017018 [Persea americana]|uniref:Uncharacterized protein n=1 Tax=Persea americana TaxID=3435 RepID=A0ACC2M401_PERAE|nr:hypothetical protein MRB53_017018 [Persea americana]